MMVLAIVGAGGIYTGTNPSYTTRELVHHFKAADAKFVVSEPEIVTSILAAVKERGIPEGNLLIFNVLGQEVPAGRRSWTDLFSHGEEDWVAFHDLQRAKETTAARLFSSGTTGLPKAVTLTHHNLIAQHELVFEAHPRPYQVSRITAMPVFHRRRGLCTRRRHQSRAHHLHDAPLRPRAVPGVQREIPGHRPDHRSAHGHRHPDVSTRPHPAVLALHQERHLRCRPAR